jgi:putative mRNA 3-end processing factor
MSKPALIVRRNGMLYCPPGDFYIDPLRPVDRAVITHAHADHARSGSGHYLASRASLPLLRHRLGARAQLASLGWSEPIRIKDTRVSLHPAGHILGSAQVRIEHRGRVAVAAGDYKRAPDPTTPQFEVLACDEFVSEATFGLPVYRWPAIGRVVDELLDWWQQCQAEQRPAVLFCYALGKAQRLLAELAPFTGRTVWLHGAMVPLTEIYRQQGVKMPPTRPFSEWPRKQPPKGELIIAPPSAAGSPWMRRLRGASTAFASGWMRIRGNRRRRGYDRGFILSDHADWPDLVRSCEETGAERIHIHHGNGEALASYLSKKGRLAGPPPPMREA